MRALGSSCTCSKYQAADDAAHACNAAEQGRAGLVVGGVGWSLLCAQAVHLVMLLAPETQASAASQLCYTEPPPHSQQQKKVRPSSNCQPS
mmetsp:Transcript_26851/g.68393  ORF Transcript_26851/g.68393 Transcript_26851/m.68393 type:complete len:91 (+) Transcript_26851:245-517(+)